MDRMAHAEALLLPRGLHGTGSNWDNYQQLFESRGYQVVAPTLVPELRPRDNPTTTTQ